MTLTHAQVVDARCGCVGSSMMWVGAVATIWLPLKTPSSRSPSRLAYCGPITMSISGTLRISSSPSCCATQPATMIAMSSPRCFRWACGPRYEYTFACACSRIEHVLSTTTCASRGSAAFANPSACSCPSILSASAEFI